MWPFKSPSPDLLIEFGNGWLPAQLLTDAVGRPYVRIYKDTILFPTFGGKTAGGRYNSWLPLSPSAAALFRRPVLKIPDLKDPST